jgi:hypothetical protein
MSVIPITIFFSLLLAGFFVVLFLVEQKRRRFGGPERDSLLPLADEEPGGAARPRPPGADGVDPSAVPGHSTSGSP